MFHGLVGYVHICHGAVLVDEKNTDAFQRSEAKGFTMVHLFFDHVIMSIPQSIARPWPQLQLQPLPRDRFHVINVRPSWTPHGIPEVSH